MGELTCFCHFRASRQQYSSATRSNQRDIHSLISPEEAQRDEQRAVLTGGQPEVTFRANTGGDQRVLDLVLGQRVGGGGELSLCAEPSSDEEDGGLGTFDRELSVNESDYPLHDSSLLEKLLYSRTDHNASPSGQPLPIGQKPPSDKTQLSDWQPSAPEQRLPPSVPMATLSEPSLSDVHSREERQSSATPPPPATSRGHEVTAHAEEEELAATESWSSISSLFGGHSKALEAAILKAIGMERLTRLGRMTAARIVVDTLSLDLESVQKVHTLRSKKKARSATASASELVTASLRFVVLRGLCPQACSLKITK